MWILLLLSLQKSLLKKKDTWIEVNVWSEPWMGFFVVSLLFGCSKIKVFFHTDCVSRCNEIKFVDNNNNNVTSNSPCHIRLFFCLICHYTSKISLCVWFHHLSLSRLRSERAYSSLAHMDSNSSMRCLVLPWRIWRRVLYLSRPAFTFSAWIRSLGVFLLSSTAPANSVLRNWKRTQINSDGGEKILFL